MTRRIAPILPAGLLLIVGGGLLLGCSSRQDASSVRAAAPPAPSPTTLPVFEDVTAERGLRFRHHTGAVGRYFMPETMGAGCAFFDYDGDGDPDILLLNGTDWTKRPGVRHTLALYRNDEGHFIDVTRAAGLDVELYAMGCAAADYDNDGDLDLFIACLGPDRLFQNEMFRRSGAQVSEKGPEHLRTRTPEHPLFRDVTRQAGVGDPRWSVGAAWLDYDRDGWLDLFVANYVDWTPTTDRYCTLTGRRKSYCTPQDYDGVPCALFRNRRDGTFEDVSRAAGIGRHVGKSLGVLVHDENADGWPDVFVANDTEPNFLFRNTGQGRFEEVGLQAGFALGETGVPRSGMGVDAADIENAGTLAVVVTNFAGEGVGCFVRDRQGLYEDAAADRNLRDPTLPFVGFGVCFLDANLDGWPDLLVANGHLQDDIHLVKPQERHAQPPLLFLNDRRGRFDPLPAGSLSDAMAPLVARGAAVADFDRDGRPDILLMANGGSPRLLRNATPGRRTWLRLTLQGARGNRSAVGARIMVRTGDLQQTQWVRAGGSYGSQSELPLTFSLVGRERADEIEVLWPSGKTERWTDIPANTARTLIESSVGRELWVEREEKPAHRRKLR